MGSGLTKKFILNNDKVKKKRIEMQLKEQEAQNEDNIDSQYKRFPEHLP